MKWYSMEGPGGTITCKGHFPNEAKAEAAAWWDCGTDEIEITGEEEYNGNEKMDQSADQKTRRPGCYGTKQNVGP